MTVISRLIGTLLLMMIFNASLYAQSLTLVVIGHGVTHPAALDDAKVNAVQRGVGVVISSEEIVSNFQLISDKIYSKAYGFVKSFRELESERQEDGTYRVKIEAEVTEILDEIAKDQTAVDLLLQWMHKPRFMFKINENNNGDTAGIVVETEIGRLMGEKNFSIMNYKATSFSAGGPENESRAEESLVDRISKQGADYLIYGTATANSVDISHIVNRDGWYSGKATVSVQIIRTSDGQIIAENNYSGVAPDISPQSAGAKGLQKAAAKLSEYLISETIRKWGINQSNFRTVKLVVEGVSRAQTKTLESFLLQKVSGLMSMYLNNFYDSTAEYSIEIQNDIGIISTALDGLKLDTFELKVVEESVNKLKVTISAL